MADTKQQATPGSAQEQGNTGVQGQGAGGTQGQGGAGGQGPQGTNGLAKFKEIVTAIIAWAVLAVTIWMLIGTFNSAALKEPGSPTQPTPIAAGQDTQAQQQALQQRQDKQREDSLKAQQDAFNNRKDIMLYGLSLLGAIIGYYFGRVPAELHAQAAQRAADNAQEQLNTTQGDLKTANDNTNAANATVIAANENANAANAKAEQVTQQSEQLKKDVKNTLTAVKTKMAAVRTPAKTLGAGAPAPSSPDLEQAERDIDALLAKL